MRDEYDFSGAIKNPYAEKIRQNGYAIVVNCGAAQNSENEPNSDATSPSSDSVAEYKATYDKVVK